MLDYLFEARAALEQRYGRFFASSAYSEFRPLTNEATEEAYRQNRRIEISVVLKDSGVREVIDDYLGGIDPSLAETEPGSAPADPSGPAAPGRPPRTDRPHPSPGDEPTAPAHSR